MQPSQLLTTAPRAPYENKIDHRNKPRKTMQRHRIHSTTWLVLALLTPILAGCVSWHPDWSRPDAASVESDPAPLLAEAERLNAGADSRSALLAAIAAHERVLAVDSDNFHSLTNLGHLYILLGAAYTDSRSEKILHFQTARRYNEWAMYTNKGFRARMDAGQKPWEAAEILDRREVPAMFYWVTAVLYHFKEGMSLPGKVANRKWIEWCGIFLHRIEDIDPNWGGGGVQFSLAIYYGALPKSLGGDRQRSDAYLARAIEIGPHWLLNRWGRAKYFHVRDGNRAGFEKDLKWVVSQDIETAGGVFAWKVYFQRDARQMLAAPERYIR